MRQEDNLEWLVNLGKVDLRIYSNYSDGGMSIEQILDYKEEKNERVSFE